MKYKVYHGGAYLCEVNAQSDSEVFDAFPEYNPDEVKVIEEKPDGTQRNVN